MAGPQHVYERAFSPDGQDSLAKVARLIAPGSRVLDLGCGPGILGTYLAGQRGCAVDGVEFDPTSMRVAAKGLRRVVQADLEQFDFAGLDGPYDYIVCADVLEHLRDPSAVMRLLPTLLAPGGKILLSIPNVSYSGLIAGLLNGEFRYRPEGLLSATHLRFFTRRSLLDWLAELGLRVGAVDTVRVELVDSEFGKEGLEGFAPALRNQILCNEDALTYQFIVEVLPGPAPSKYATVAQAAPSAVTFLTQLFWRASQSLFDENRCALARPAMGVEAQRIRLHFPALPSQEFALKFDLADRPGYLRLFTMAVYDAAGACLWKWDGSRAQLENSPTQALTFIDDEQPGQLIVSLGNDPWIELPFHSTEPNALIRGGYLEVDLSWPMSADGFALARQLDHQGLQGLFEPLQVELEEAKAELQRLRHDNEFLRTTLDHLNESVTLRLGRPLFSVMNRLRNLGRRKP